MHIATRAENSNFKLEDFSHLSRLAWKLGAVTVNSNKGRLDVIYKLSSQNLGLGTFGVQYFSLWARMMALLG